MAKGEIPPKGMKASIDDIYRLRKSDSLIENLEPIQTYTNKNKSGYKFVEKTKLSTTTRFYLELDKNYLYITYIVADPYNKGVEAIGQKIIEGLKFN